MKKLLSVLPSTLQGGFRGGLLFLVLLATTTLWAYDFKSADLYYNITSDSTVEVTEGGYSGEVIIPETVTYNGVTYSVTRIGERAFYNSSITSVTIPASVISIEEYNFYESKYIKTVYLKSTTPPILNGGKIFDTSRPTCYIPCGTLDAYKASEWANLMKQFVEECEEEDSTNIITYTSSDGKVVRPYTYVFGANIVSNEYKDGQGVITFGGPVTNIGDRAFYKCTSLTSITIPNSVTSIGSTAFSGTSITYLTIPESVTSIGNQAFSHCSSLTSITIPESVANIEWSAFDNCSALIKTNYTGDIAGWCNIKFGSDRSNPMYYSHNFYINDQDIKDLVIPNTVDTIHNYAFYNCSSLTSITIPNSVTSIGDFAFESCSGLTSIAIPESVTNIGEGAFYGTSIDSVCVKATTPPMLNIGKYPVFSTSPTCYIPCGTLDTYKASKWANLMSQFVEECEEDSTNIITYTSSDGKVVQPYKTDVFGAKIVSNEYKDGQGVITFDGPVTSIGDRAFYKCSSLTSVTIPESVTSIGNSAFESCSALTSITIPNSVTSIGDIAFAYCSSLTYITIPNSVSKVGGGIFCRCKALTSVELSENITSLPTYYDSGAINPLENEQVGFFGWCSSLTSITIPENITHIGMRAFYYCTRLDTIVWNAKNCTNIDEDYVHHYRGAKVFYESREVSSFIFGEQVRHIPAYMCSGMKKLTSITIPKSVTSIGDGAFAHCSSLISCTIPNSVSKIGGGIFCGCEALISVELPESITSLSYYHEDYSGSYAGFFENCSSLTSVTIPESVTSIGNYAFYNCSSLTSVTIPENVRSIVEYAFSGCSSLASITCEATTPPTLGSDIFYQVSKSIPVYVPCGCVSAYKAAKYWNDFTNIQEPLADFAIAVNVNNSTMGTAKVDKNTSCGNQISATSNYGYHFVQWSDGVIDNPRTLTLTQDTILTAEFAPNNYSVSTQSSDTKRGTTRGDTVVNYLEYVTISATANYGYHFTQWNDKNTSNPRQIQATQDQNYTAYFNKNTYSISLSCNEVQGEVEGPTYAEYLDVVTFTATANYGYHFVQWSDGVTDNPRTLTLTQDTVLTAEFALTTAGQCGKNLYWVYDTNASILTITGSGDMYNERPWGLFANDLTEVALPEGLTHIGDGAFVDCINLKAITIPASVTSIGANSFAGCRRIRDVYCYPLMPPYAEATSFANYNANLNVPCDFLEDYQYDPVFGSFKYFICMGAESDNTDSDEVVITPGTTDVTIVWPTEEDADTYSIVIYKDGRVFCTLTFNANGQLLNIAFAPGRDGNRPAQYAEQVANGYRFTVTGLTESTKYEYNITTKDESDNTISTHSGEFTTKSNTPTDLENNDIQCPISDTRKLLRDNQLLILHNGKTYNVMGAEIQ